MQLGLASVRWRFSTLSGARDRLRQLSLLPRAQLGRRALPVKLKSWQMPVTSQPS